MTPEQLEDMAFAKINAPEPQVDEATHEPESTEPVEAATESEQQGETPANEQEPTTQEENQTQEETTPETYSVKLGEEDFDLDIDDLKLLAQKGAESLMSQKEVNQKIENFETQIKEKDTQIEQLSEVARNLIDNPVGLFSYLSENGVRIEDACREYLSQIEGFEKLDPNQKELLKSKRELESLKYQRELEKKDAEKRAKEQEEARQQQEIAQLQQEYSQKITSSLEQSGIKATRVNIGLMADTLSAMAQNGIPLDFNVAAKRVAEYSRELAKSQLGSFENDDELANFLGEDTVERIRKRELSKLKKSQKVPKGTENKTPLRRDKNKRYMTQDELMAQLEERFA